MTDRQLYALGIFFLLGTVVGSALTLFAAGVR